MIHKIEERLKHFANLREGVLTPFSEKDAGCEFKLGVVNLKTRTIRMLSADAR